MEREEIIGCSFFPPVWSSPLGTRTKKKKERNPLSLSPTFYPSLFLSCIWFPFWYYLPSHYHNLILPAAVVISKKEREGERCLQSSKQNQTLQRSRRLLRTRPLASRTRTRAKTSRNMSRASNNLYNPNQILLRLPLRYFLFLSLSLIHEYVDTFIHGFWGFSFSFICNRRGKSNVKNPIQWMCFYPISIWKTRRRRKWKKTQFKELFFVPKYLCFSSPFSICSVRGTRKLKSHLSNCIFIPKTILCFSKIHP